MQSCQLSNSFQQGSTKAIAIHAWHRICEGGGNCYAVLHQYADVLHAATTANSLLSLIAVTAATGTALNCCYCRCCSNADWLLATQASCMISAIRTRLCSLSRHHSHRCYSDLHVLLSAYGTCTHHTCTRWKAAGRPLVHGHVDKLVYTVLHSPLLHPADVWLYKRHTEAHIQCSYASQYNFQRQSCSGHNCTPLQALKKGAECGPVDTLARHCTEPCFLLMSPAVYTFNRGVLRDVQTTVNLMHQATPYQWSE
eukprot:5040-Heterococcus_DN1.PRE.1